MHSDTGSGTGFWPGTYIKCNTKVKKLKMRGQFSGIQYKALLALKRQDFVKNFCC
jgi:hypothetical protein